jgi:hypothetical protein
MKMETSVAIDTKPDVPRDLVGTMLMLTKVSSELGRHLTAYLKEGNISELRKSTNCMMILQSMQTKTYLRQLLAAGMRGVHPISDEERKSILQIFDQPA